jgi:3,8-divinyl chlorophyllide a/chlorophyllide a reductase subunit Z
MYLNRDISDTSSFWGAAWVFGCFPDAHIICDAPIGCFAMLGLGVTDYTDTVPHFPNLTPTVIREQDVINGTAEALKRTIENLRTLGYLENKHLIVVSSAESEMIGADHGTYLKQLDPDARFFWSQSLEQDEWVGRERAMLYAWREYGQPYATETTPAPNRVNILGPTMGCFNAPSDLHEIVRLVTGIGGEINLIYPYESSIATIRNLPDAAVNIVMYREFGEAMAKELDRPYLFAPFGIQGTTQFLYQLGDLMGTPREQVDAFIETEKRRTLRTIWDMWLGPQSDWFATIDCCIVSGRSYVEGLKAFFGEELGINVVWAAGQPRADDEPDNTEIRKRLHEKAPAFVFGTVNERIYMAEVGAKSHFIPAAFPGPIVRRAVGTPFMGYAGTAYLMQEILNRLYEIVFNFLPVDPVKREAPAHGPPGAAGPPPSVPPVPPTASSDGDGSMPWSEDATTRLHAAVEHIPFIGRVSATRAMRQAAERLSRTRGLKEVSLDVLEETLSQGE